MAYEKFGKSLNVVTSEPFDARQLIKYESGLTSSYWVDNEFNVYNGMLVITRDTKKPFILVDKNNTTDINSWKDC